MHLFKHSQEKGENYFEVLSENWWDNDIISLTIQNSDVNKKNKTKNSQLTWLEWGKTKSTKEINWMVVAEETNTAHERNVWWWSAYLGGGGGDGNMRVADFTLLYYLILHKQEA